MVLVGNRTIKHAYNKKWLLIFHHNVSGGYFSKNEVLDSKNENKFSCLGELEKYRINGKFAFLLEYPEYEGYISCIQSSNPTNTTQVKDFYLLHNSWSDGVSFEGFALSSDSSTFIDGSPNYGNWFHAIGQYTNWGFGKIAGPYDYFHKITNFNIVNLWVGISNNEFSNKANKYKRYSIFVLIFNIMFIC